MGSRRVDGCGVVGGGRGGRGPVVGGCEVAAAAVAAAAAALAAAAASAAASAAAAALNCILASASANVSWDAEGALGGCPPSGCSGAGGGCLGPGGGCCVPRLGVPEV